MAVPTLSQVRAWAGALGELRELGHTATVIADELADKGNRSIATTACDAIVEVDWSGRAKSAADARVEREKADISELACGYAELGEMLLGASEDLAKPLHAILDLIAHHQPDCPVADNDPTWTVIGPLGAGAAGGRLHERLFALAHTIAETDDRWAARIGHAGRRLHGITPAEDAPAHVLTASYRARIVGIDTTTVPRSEPVGTSAGLRPGRHPVPPAAGRLYPKDSGTDRDDGTGFVPADKPVHVPADTGKPAAVTVRGDERARLVERDVETVTRVVGAVEFSAKAVGTVLDMPFVTADTAAGAAADLIAKPFEPADKIVTSAGDIEAKLIDDADKLHHATDHPTPSDTSNDPVIGKEGRSPGSGPPRNSVNRR